MKKVFLLFLSAVFAIPAYAAPAENLASVAQPHSIINKTISENEVLNAQNQWCRSLLDIGNTYEQRGRKAAEKSAQKAIEDLYGYDMGPVLFKPTLSVKPQTFRTTPEGALSYFVGGNKNFPTDKGFALKGWTKCEPENAALFISGNTATTMGKVHFTNKDGHGVTVDKTWQFIKGDDGRIRIILHHSSLEHTEQH
ncbi:hypothetical protein [Neisseria sp. S1]|uniref:hypothetical protein n=1 Tax=Neisseria sp. S1 TaxID=3318354 RepID=UPI003A8445BA